MRRITSMTAGAVVATSLFAGALALLPGCRVDDPWTRPVVLGTINCPDCGCNPTLLPAAEAGKKEHVCLSCKEVWDPRIYKGSDWVMVCEKCDKAIGTCPSCQKKAEQARTSTS